MSARKPRNQRASGTAQAEEPPPPRRRTLPPLLRRAWYGLNQAFRRRIATHRTTPDQYSVLRWLSEAGPDGLTQRELTALMASDPNTIASILARLETTGRVRRQPHERDRRANRVQITPAGRRLFTTLRTIAQELQASVLGALPARQQATFLRQLEQVANAAQQALRDA